MAFRICLADPSCNLPSVPLTFSLDLEYRYTFQRETQAVTAQPLWVAKVCLA
jgi:hypothetical protein